MTTAFEARLHSIQTRHARGVLTDLDALAEAGQLQRDIEAAMAREPKWAQLSFAAYRWITKRWKRAA